MSTCGADAGVSCCASLEVSGGTFYRTYTSTDAGPTAEADPATVSGFRLDEYLVTVGRFRQFVGAAVLPDGGAGWVPPAGSGKHTHLNGGLGLVDVAEEDAGVAYEPGWLASDDQQISPTDSNLSCAGAYDTWTNSPGTQESFPMTCINWWEAYAFCIWDGGFLPSDAEAEYAAAGGSEQLQYPWGSTAPGTGNEYAIYGCYYPSGTGDGSYLNCTGVTNIAPVGTTTLGAGRWGQLDLAGELIEWNLDWWNANAAYVDPCTDCVYLTETGLPYVAVQDSAYDDPGSVLSPRFFSVDPVRDSAVGFRCARSP